MPRAEAPGLLVREATRDPGEPRETEELCRSSRPPAADLDSCGRRPVLEPPPVLARPLRAAMPEGRLFLPDSFRRFESGPSSLSGAPSFETFLRAVPFTFEPEGALLRFSLPRFATLLDLHPVKSRPDAIAGPFLYARVPLRSRIHARALPPRGRTPSREPSARSADLHAPLATHRLSPKAGGKIAPCRRGEMPPLRNALYLSISFKGSSGAPSPTLLRPQRGPPAREGSRECSSRSASRLNSPLSGSDVWDLMVYALSSRPLPRFTASGGGTPCWKVQRCRLR